MAHRRSTAATGRLIIAAVFAVAAVAPRAGIAADVADTHATVLERYLNGLNTLSSEFTQTVTDAHGTQTEAGSGSLQVQRPDKFRWDYRPRAGQDGAAASGGAASGGAASGTPANGSTGSGTTASGGSDDESGQLMVADGKNLWFYDRELAQVTVKPVGAALSSTPIMLLSSSPQQLRASFQIMPGAARDGLQWVDVKPRGAQADFSSAELGFDDERLARMLVHDNLGQTVRIDFSHSERNAPLAAPLFQFKPVAGVDVIGTAQ